MADTDAAPNGDPAYIISSTKRSVANVYSGRQSIVDRCGALVDYKLLFRHDRTGGVCVTDADHASAQVLCNTVDSFDMSRTT